MQFSLTNSNRLRFESLECRRLLAILVVDTIEDGFEDDGMISLVEAIHAANLDTVTVTVISTNLLAHATFVALQRN